MGQHLDFSHVYQRMWVFVSFAKVFKGLTWASQDHLVSRLGNEFTDVTLAWEDGQLVEALKVILISCSPQTSTPTLFHIRQVSQRPVSEWLSDWQGKAMIRLQSNKSNASNNHYIYILLFVYLLCWRWPLNFRVKGLFFLIFYWILSNIKINHGCCPCAHLVPPDYFSWLGCSNKLFMWFQWFKGPKLRPNNTVYTNFCIKTFLELIKNLPP